MMPKWYSAPSSPTTASLPLQHMYIRIHTYKQRKLKKHKKPEQHKH